VGKSVCNDPVRQFHADHPHVRGEKAGCSSRGLASTGSSPRAWGKGYGIKLVACHGRIIPTCVGKSTRSARGYGPVPDHPHVRGEKTGCLVYARPVLGSSPRAWGKESVTCAINTSTRIIPTCVGKSPDLYSTGHGRSDHPHVRGEKTSPQRPAAPHTGSSPRAWGKVETPI